MKQWLNKFLKKDINIIFASLLIIIIVQNFGLFKTSLYTMSSSGFQGASITHFNKNNLSYELHIYYKEAMIKKVTFYAGNIEPLIIEARLSDIEYSGNYYTPIYKDFKAEYKCTFSINNETVSNIECTKYFQVFGLMSIFQAKDLAFKDAFIELENAFRNLITKPVN